MQKVYSHQNGAMVHLVRNELETHGIEAIVRGEHAAAVMGGGAGVDAWVELWIVDEDRVPEAERIVQEVMAAESAEAGEPWACPQCGTEVEAQFGACWNCGADRPADGTRSA